jgi:hypothetical protein
MFAGKAEAYPREAPFEFSRANLERLATDKHSNILQKFVNQRPKSYITLAPELHFSLFCFHSNGQMAYKTTRNKQTA